MCIGTLQEVNSKIAALREAGIEVVAVSADKEDVASALVGELSLSFPVVYGLEEDVMHELGLYVSDPTNYIAQSHRFAEPGYFFLTSTSKIQYVSIASHPMGGRVNGSFDRRVRVECATSKGKSRVRECSVGISEE